MRSLTDVIEQILKHVPADQEQLLAGLTSCRASSLFSPPEAQHERWNETAFLLQHHFGDDRAKFAPWQEQVIKLWRGEEASS